VSLKNTISDDKVKPIPRQSKSRQAIPNGSNNHENDIGVRVITRAIMSGIMESTRLTVDDNTLETGNMYFGT